MTTESDLVLIEYIHDLDIENIILNFGSQKGFVLLDSTDHSSKWSRYQIIACDPFMTITGVNGKLVIDKNGSTQTKSISNPFDQIQLYLNDYNVKIFHNDSPFLGGAIGYVSYETARYLDDFKHIFFQSTDIDFCFGLYSQVLVHDLLKNKWITIKRRDLPNQGIVSLLNKTELKSRQSEVLSHLSFEKFEAEISKEFYIDQIANIQKFIKNGHIYQANYSFPFSVEFKGISAELYVYLRQRSPAPYAAFLNFGNMHILSVSPELFFEKDKDYISTRPIKGTIARGENEAQDNHNKFLLQQSKKDIAELTMITDLERNDLAKVCRLGSISVMTLRDIETYKTVHHGVSCIEGEIAEKKQTSDVLSALFPGGSITGTPKIRAMEVLAETELSSRSVYTGIIGYIDFNDNSQFNIAIRTLYRKDDILKFHAGGGIVADSRSHSEWNECFVKVKGFIDIIESKGRQ